MPNILHPLFETTVDNNANYIILETNGSCIIALTEVDLANLTRAKEIELKNHGDNLIGHCPFHNDRTPSLIVTPSKNLWHCMGACQVGGSVIDWVMKMENVAFRHAVELLLVGDASVLVASKPRARAPKLPPPVSLTADDQMLVKQVIEFYHETLKVRAPEAIKYLESRGINDPSLIEKFKLGFSNRTLGLRDRALMEVLYSTGIRRSEIANLTIHDINPSQGVLTVVQGKGKRDRVLPIGQRALAWVDQYVIDARPALVSDPDHGRLFVMTRGSEISPKVVGYIVREYIEKAEIGKKGSCHLFRHAMATALLENGAEIKFLQQMLGHQQIQSTQVYGNISIRKLKEAHERLHPGANLEPSQAKKLEKEPS